MAGLHRFPAGDGVVAIRLSDVAAVEPAAELLSVDTEIGRVNLSGGARSHVYVAGNPRPFAVDMSLEEVIALVDGAD